jgi:hypothetical protein
MPKLMTNLLKFVKEINNSIKKASKYKIKRNLISNLKFIGKKLFCPPTFIFYYSVPLVFAILILV